MAWKEDCNCNLVTNFTELDQIKFLKITKQKLLINDLTVTNKNYIYIFESESGKETMTYFNSN